MLLTLFFMGFLMKVRFMRKEGEGEGKNYFPD